MKHLEKKRLRILNRKQQAYPASIGSSIFLFSPRTENMIASEEMAALIICHLCLLLFAVSLMLEYEQCFKYICFYSLKVEQALVQMRMWSSTRSLPAENGKTFFSIGNRRHFLSYNDYGINSLYFCYIPMSTEVAHIIRVIQHGVLPRLSVLFSFFNLHSPF